MRQLSALLRTHSQRKPQQVCILSVHHRVNGTCTRCKASACFTSPASGNSGCQHFWPADGLIVMSLSTLQTQLACGLNLRCARDQAAAQARAPRTFNITAVATAAVQPSAAGRPQLREAVLAPLARPHLCHNRQPDTLVLPTHREAAAVVEVQLRLLVPASHIGCIIGRRGEMIRSIRDDTGAHIKVHEGSQGALHVPFLRKQYHPPLLVRYWSAGGEDLEVGGFVGEQCPGGSVGPHVRPSCCTPSPALTVGR